jgi:hypothetical protein
MRGLRIRRHFHVIKSERRTLYASARASLALLGEEGRGRKRTA